MPARQETGHRRVADEDEVDRQYLGDGYEVLSSVGHIRDLIEPEEHPARAQEGLARQVLRSTSRTASIRTTSSTTRKKKTVAELKRALKDADELLLATDEDREGEAIAWHLLEVLKPKVPVSAWSSTRSPRTRSRRRVDNTRELDTRARRRAGDPPHPRPPLRLRGVARCSGARSSRACPPAASSPPRPGMVVDRERERMAFVSAVVLGPDRRASPSRTPRVASRPGSPASTARALARGRDFDDRGELKKAVRRARRGRGANPRRRDRGRGRRHPSRRSSRSPVHAAARAPRSPPRPCSRRPAASSR